MRLEQLEYLIEINKCHSISLASQKLHLSQQSMSKAIQNLELELDTTLLARTSQGTYLTPEGHQVIKRAQKIFAELHSLKNDLKTARQGDNALRGNLRIMHTNAFNMHVLAASIQAFAADYPYVQTIVHQKSLSKILKALWENTIDLGLITLTEDFHLNSAIDSHQLKDLTIHPLMEDALIAAVSSASPLAAQKSISINALLKKPLLLLQHENDDDLHSNWFYHLLQNYDSPHFTLVTNRTDLYLKAIADGTGIGFFTYASKKWFNACQLENISIIPIRPAIPLLYSYVTNAANPLSAAAEAYLPYLTRHSGHA